MAIASLKSCTIGVQKGEPCHKTVYCRVQETKSKNEIGTDELKLIEGRSEASAIGSVCLHHFKKYLTRYESLQKTCCDPFNNHEKAFSSM